MSTNDTVLVLANGSRQMPGQTRQCGTLKAFQAALNHVAGTREMTCATEGVHRVVTVRGMARRRFKTDAAARAVAKQCLVKTSWHGGEPVGSHHGRHWLLPATVVGREGGHWL